MKCFECDETTQIKKYKAFNYKGVGLDNIVLLNVDVEICPKCDTKTPLLQNVAKLHNAIGVAIALQMTHLSGSDIRYLRRSSGFNVGDWAKRLNVAEGTYSKWENGHRPITPQADKLARINFLMVLKQRDQQNVGLSKHLAFVLDLSIERRREFVIGIDVGKTTLDAKYMHSDDLMLVEPETAFVEATILPKVKFANVKLAKVKVVTGRLVKASAINQETVVYG